MTWLRPLYLWLEQFLGKEPPPMEVQIVKDAFMVARADETPEFESTFI